MKKINYNKEIIEKLDKIIDLLKSEITEQSLIKLEMKDYMTPRYLWEECKKLFPCWIYDEKFLDTITSERKGNYTIYFKSVQEADEENKNLSAKDLEVKGIKGITLEERLLLEIEYFKKTGKHLDTNSWTLCSGSRADGSVPGAAWDCGKFSVGWNHPGSRYDDLRARSAVLG